MVVPYLMDKSHGRFGVGEAGLTASDALVLPPKFPAPTINVEI